LLSAGLKPAKKVKSPQKIFFQQKSASTKKTASQKTATTRRLLLRKQPLRRKPQARSQLPVKNCKKINSTEEKLVVLRR